MATPASFEATFTARLAALETLLAAREGRFADSEALRAHAGRIDALTPCYEETAVGAGYSAFAELLRIAALLVQWRSAVLEGESEASRFLKAARARRRLWVDERASAEWVGPAFDAVEGVDALEEVGELGALLTRFAAVPLPIGIYAKEPRDRNRTQRPQEERAAELVVAFLTFAIDGQPAAETHFIPPNESHDLELEVRVSRWPEGAEHLELRPMSIEAASTYELPVFTFSRPAGEPPLVLRDRGRAVIRTPQGLNARPFEFRYSASFLPTAVEQPVSVLGQRDLRIESVDLRSNSLTGHPGLDRKIIEVRDRLRSRYNVPPEELGDALRLTTALANLMSRVLQDNEIPEALAEKAFQRLVRAELRRRPEIGAQLSEHPAAGGGLTDLALNGVPLELKAERVRRLTLADCQPFVAQATSYAVSNGKRVGLLCVLDSSPKVKPAFPAEDGLGLLFNDENEDSVPIIVLLIQANLARPSGLQG